MIHKEEEPSSLNRVIYVNGHFILFFVDTGAEVSTISTRDVGPLRGPLNYFDPSFTLSYSHMDRCRM